MLQLRIVTAAIGALLGLVSASLDPITVQEQEFIDSQTGDRFVVVGVDYQPGGSAGYGTGQGDPLSNPKACLRDAALMQNLGINTIRCYNVDPTLNHDECVSIFDSVGIYMIIDVNSPLPGQSINSDDPSSTYNSYYLQHIFGVVDAFMNYPNVLGFFSGNEVIDSFSAQSTIPPYIRAVQRDLKSYIKNNAPRQIPVGYSAADLNQTSVQDQWAYLQCSISGDDGDLSRSDFFGLNDYQWCGDMSSFTISGYNVLVEDFGRTTIPVFFSEYGCNDPEPRYFDEVPTLYGPQMTVMSGGLVYQWTQDTNDYGLVQVNNNGSAELLRDYNTLKAKYDTLNVDLLKSQNNTATSLQPPTCNADLIIESSFSKNFNLPDTPSEAQGWISNGLGGNKGSIISVTQTSVQYPVYQTDGAQVQDLHIVTGTRGANYPGAVTATAGSGGSSGSNSGSTSKSKGAAAAPTPNVAVVRGAVAAAALGAVAFAL